MERHIHFPLREFCQDWKSQGILPKILEKSEKILLKNWKKYRKSLGNLSASNSENPANMVPYFKIKKNFKKNWKTAKNTGKVREIC